MDVLLLRALDPAVMCLSNRCLGMSLYVAILFNNCVLWVITPCSLLETNRHFEGTCRLHRQGRKISETRIQYEAGSKKWSADAIIYDERHYKTQNRIIFFCSYLLTLVPCLRIFLPWRWRQYVPPKHRLTQDRHDATSQKATLFIVTAVKT
jgi:hypothetical protein